MDSEGDFVGKFLLKFHTALSLTGDWSTLCVFAFMRADPAPSLNGICPYYATDSGNWSCRSREKGRSEKSLLRHFSEVRL